MEKEKFYKKTWFAIVMTIFVYPVGMFFIWINENLSKKAKIITTVLGAIFFLSILTIDTSAPEIILSGESSMVVTKGDVITSEELVNSSVSSISDNKTEMSTSDIIVDGYENVDFDTEGKYKVKFTAIDQAENKATVPFTINVELSEEQKAEIEAAEIAAAEEEALMTSGEWTLYDQPYKFAVEQKDYDGDIYKSGEYTFVPQGSTGKKGDISAVYDIYVTNTDYTSISDLVENEKIVCTAGGMTNLECGINLEEGNYVYIVPTDNVNGAHGYLAINKK